MGWQGKCPAASYCEGHIMKKLFGWVKSIFINTADNSEQLPKTVVSLRPVALFPPPAKPQIVVPRAEMQKIKPRLRKIHERQKAIKRSGQPYWKESGWTRKAYSSGIVYRGYYRTKYESCKGKIEESVYSGDFKFFVFNPPVSLQKHPHGVCFFNHVGKGEFFIHFQEKPLDVDSGIMAIERVLHESLTFYQGGMHDITTALL
jgi:hypothetical protein